MYPTNMWLLDTINLPLTIVSVYGKEQVNRIIEFLVVKQRSDNNIILGCLALFQLQAIHRQYMAWLRTRKEAGKQPKKEEIFTTTIVKDRDKYQ